MILNLPQITHQVGIHLSVSQGFHCGLYSPSRFSHEGSHAPYKPQLSFLSLLPGFLSFHPAFFVFLTA